MNDLAPHASPQSATLSLAELNALPVEAFTEVLGDIYEHAPWVAGHAARHRPFASIGNLRDTMADIVAAAPIADRRALLNAHPELGQSGTLTAASTLEQHHSGVRNLAPERATAFGTLNARYRDRFGFPFIIAVRGQKDIDAIIEAVERRLQNSSAVELETALLEVVRIAGFRLERRVLP